MQKIFVRILLLSLFLLATISPNKTEKNSVFNTILAQMSQCSLSTVDTALDDLYNALAHNQVDAFIAHMRLFYSEIPYTIAIEKEKYYQTIFYVILKLLNIRAEVEHATNIGRIDLVAETDDFLYIFEFKLNGSAEHALQQIYTTRYYEPYIKLGKRIILVGVNFSSKEKNIAEYLFEEFVYER